MKKLGVFTLAQGMALGVSQHDISRPVATDGLGSCVSAHPRQNRIRQRLRVEHPIGVGDEAHAAEASEGRPHSLDNLSG